ncbi:MAG: HlyD family efflux transporter periplasmic adaptor subunit, partial [Betaproteobacteria bacterium]|nr:HlyD family efflux transporter periplasmic adaptor subunit [Betaproteobacteria bacterium]
KCKLFRDEVFEAKKDTWLGQVVLIRPISFAYLSGAAAFLAAFIVGALFVGEYTRKAKVPGYIAPAQGLIKIAPQQSGIVALLKVKEGDTVKKGDVLAVINTERTSAGGGTQAEMDRQIGVRRDTLLQDKSKLDVLFAQQQRAAESRLAALRGEVAQLDATIRLQQERVRIAEHMADKHRKLYAEKFISELALQQKEQERLAELGNLENLKRNRSASQREITALDADLKLLPLKRENELSALERNLAGVEQDRIENETRREFFLVAPQDGTITALTTHTGKLAAAGQPLMNLIPAGSDLRAEVYVPAQSAGFIREGQKALLQYQAYPYQKFGTHEAQVVKVAKTAVAANELPFPAEQGALYYVATLALSKQTVTAYGKEEPLQSGMLLQANILLDRRKLIEWVFEPLYSITGQWRAG